jgi:phosphoenolpyruvate synthase/pyruvate phosphate dikinase
MPAQSYVRWFSDFRLNDLPEVAGKNASLGGLYSMLAANGLGC